MTNKPRIYNGKRSTSSINDAGKNGQPHTKNKTGPLSYTIYKINSNGLQI